MAATLAGTSDLHAFRAGTGPSMPEASVTGSVLLHPAFRARAAHSALLQAGEGHPIAGRVRALDVRGRGAARSGRWS